MPTPPAELPAVPVDCPWPIVLGIDPGTRVLGYGAVVDVRGELRLLAAGAVRPDGAELPARLADLRRELDALLARLRPAVVVVETGFTAANAQSALRLGEGRGVVLSCAAATGAEVVQYAPSVAKKTLVGNGRADKQQVARMVATILGLEEAPRPLDVTDALSLALAHLQRGRTLGALQHPSSKSRLTSRGPRR
jgi:crossover junction endodeoxyribonuclease RuvC